jgi:hypothetical protein
LWRGEIIPSFTLQAILEDLIFPLSLREREKPLP